MKAYTYISPGKFELIDKPKPELQSPRDAIARITLGSICTSDLHIKHGSVPRAVLGITVGHEMVGIVEEVGSEVHSDKATLWAFLERWFDSEREFKVRFAVIVSMCYFLSEEWLDNVFERINGLDFNRIQSNYKTVKGKPKAAQQGTVQGAEPYYVRMGVAWLLATALAKFPDQTRTFVRSSNLPEDVVKLYARKSRESRLTKTVEAL